MHAETLVLRPTSAVVIEKDHSRFTFLIFWSKCGTSMTNRPLGQYHSATFSQKCVLIISCGNENISGNNLKIRHNKLKNLVVTAFSLKKINRE